MWGWRQDSNPQPVAYKATALPLSYASVLARLRVPGRVPLGFHRVKEPIDTERKADQKPTDISEVPDLQGQEDTKHGLQERDRTLEICECGH